MSECLSTDNEIHPQNGDDRQPAGAVEQMILAVADHQIGRDQQARYGDSVSGVMGAEQIRQPAIAGFQGQDQLMEDHACVAPGQVQVQAEPEVRGPQRPAQADQ